MNRRILFGGAAALLMMFSSGLPTAQATGDVGPVSCGESTWAPAGSLSAGVHRHAAARLSDGQALVSGGYVGGPSTLAQVWDEMSGWRNVTPMAVPRYGHTLTRLTDGRVLVAGGSSSMSVTQTAEIFDPGSETWSTVAPMTARRMYHTATLLSDGRVLVVGGDNPSPQRTAEVFDPMTGSWTPVGSMAWDRHAHTVTLLNDGRVLVTGGEGNGSSYASAEIYDPITATWSSVASMGTIRFDHSALLLSSGEVLVAGGSNYSNPYLATSEIFDPITMSWRSAGALTIGRASAQFFNGSSGPLLVGGSVAGFTATPSSERFDEVTHAWGAGPVMSTPRRVFTLTDVGSDRALAVGGLRDLSTGTSSTELLSPPPPASLPDSPESFRATSALASPTIQLSWSLPSNDGGCPIVSYRVYRGHDAATLEPLTDVGATEQAFQDETQLGRAWIYAVSARTAAGHSPASPTACAVAGTPPRLGATAVCPVAGNIEGAIE